MVSQTTNDGVFYISADTQFSTLEDLENTTGGAFYNDGEAFIYRGFHNDGAVDFYEDTGLTRFIGSAAQEISGGQESFLYDVYFSNASAAAPFHLSGMLNASGTVDFHEGVVDNDNYGGTFTFNTEANHMNTSDFSHVDGEVYKLGEAEFTYPVGDGGYYRFAAMSAPAAETDNFRGKYFLESPDALYPLSQKEEGIQIIDNAEYWTVDRASGNSDVLLTFSWRDVTTPFEITDNVQEDNIHIVRWDENNALWVDEGGVADVNNQAVTTAVSGYGVFTLARVDNNLPCELEIYNAVSANGNGKNDYFNISLLDGGYDTSCFQNMGDVSVTVFNRWGVEVYKENSYGNGNVFRGYSGGRITLDEGHKLPTGTYFYILEFDYDNDSGAQHYKDAGYLYLTTDDQ